MTDIVDIGLAVDSTQVERGTRALGRFGRQAGKTQKATDRLNASLKTATGNLRQAAMAASAMTATGALLTKGVISTAAEFEQYNIRLKAVLGSTERGNMLFQDMVKFASRVPFSFREIMGAATQLASVSRGGIEEVNKMMPLIADLAAASGLGIQETTDQVVRMMSAGAASADLFRERGVLAMMGFQSGVTYSAEETKKRLISAWEDQGSKFRGASLDMAQSWDGLMSMLGDKWTLFTKGVADAGLFNFFKSVAKALNDDLGGSMKQQQTVAKALSDAIIQYTESAALGLASVVDAMSGPMDTASSAANQIWEGYKKLPSWAQEVGVFGAIIGGKKGVLLVGTVAAIGNAAERTGKLMGLVAAGQVDFWDAARMNAEEADAALAKFDKRMQALGVNARAAGGGSPLIDGTSAGDGARAKVLQFFDDVKRNMQALGESKATTIGAVQPTGATGQHDAEAARRERILIAEGQWNADRIQQAQDYYDQLRQLAYEAQTSEEQQITDALARQAEIIDMHRQAQIQAGIDQRTADLEAQQAYEDATIASLARLNELKAQKYQEDYKRKSQYQKFMLALDQQQYGSAIQMFGQFASMMTALGGKNFEQNKKVQIAIATIKGMGTVMNAIEHGSQTGGIYGAAIEGAIATATVAAQIMKIKSASIGSGGGVSAPTGAGAAAPTQQPAAPVAQPQQQQPQAAPSLKVIVNAPSGLVDPIAAQQLADSLAPHMTDAMRRGMGQAVV